MPQPVNTSQRFGVNRILIGGLALYVCAFAILLRNKSFDATGAVVVLIAFGIVFPLIAWMATRRAIPPSISITPGKSQLIVLIGYIIVLSVYLVSGPQWIDQHLPSSWIDSARASFSRCSMPSDRAVNARKVPRQTLGTLRSCALKSRTWSS